MFKKHTYLHIYYEGARPVSSLVAFTQKDQTLFKIASFFTVFTQNLRLLGVGGVMKFTIYVPLFLLMLRTKFGEERSSSSWEEVENTQLLTHDWRRNARWTKTDAYP